MKGKEHYDCLIIDDEQLLADRTCEFFNMFEVKTAAVYDSGQARKIRKIEAYDMLRAE